MKTEHFILPALACSLLSGALSPRAVAASVTLGWDPLDDPSVVGYVLHYGQRSGHYINALQVTNGTSATVRGLAANTIYYFSITSYDSAGFESVYSDEISWFIPAPLTVTRSGPGTVFTQTTPTADPDINTYTIVAHPSAGMIFAGWTGSISSYAAKLSFVCSSNVVLQAHFIPNPFPAIHGVYNGLLTSDGQPDVATSGTFSVWVSRLGGYSGRLQVGTEIYRFSGRLDAQCHAGISLSHLKERPLTLSLAVGTDDRMGQISGTFSDGDWLANLSGERAVFNATNDPAPFAGSYTVVFPGTASDPLRPTGDGFGTVRVFRSGLTVLSGALADGAKLRQTANLSTSSRWPLFQALYDGNGAIVGWPAFTNLQSGAGFGRVTWIKPAEPSASLFSSGFTTLIEALGSAYVPPIETDDRVVSMTNGDVVYSGGNLDSTFTNSVTVAPRGHVTGLSSTGLNLAISPGTGIFHGNTIDLSSGQPFAFNGAVLQNLNAGFGFLLGKNLGSRVIIAPAD